MSTAWDDLDETMKERRGALELRKRARDEMNQNSFGTLSCLEHVASIQCDARHAAALIVDLYESI